MHVPVYLDMRDDPPTGIGRVLTAVLIGRCVDQIAYRRELLPGQFVLPPQRVYPNSNCMNPIVASFSRDCAALFAACLTA